MTEGEVKPVLFPTYQPPAIVNPAGVPAAHVKQSAFLIKAVKALGKITAPKTRKGLRTNQTVRIKHKKVKFY